MTDNSRNARIAGFLYVLLGIVAPLRLIYIPGKIFVTGDAAATAANIAANETLFRLGIASDLLAGTIVLFVTFALYRLFRDVDRRMAVLMVILGGLMVTPIYYVNTLNDAAALMLIRGGDYLAVFDKSQLDALALLFLRLHGHGVVVNEVFWGLWLFPFGWLIVRSGFLPRFLGVLLFVNGLAYLVVSLIALVWPQHNSAAANWLFPAMLGEVVVMLWLLVMGARDTRPANRSVQGCASGSAVSMQGGNPDE